MLADHSRSYVKFNPTWIEEDAVSAAEIIELNELRAVFRDYHLLGEKMAVLQEGEEAQPVGFGNVSMRKAGSSDFVITGTNTGRFDLLEPGQYSLVSDVNIRGNTLTCRGLIKASAESMTHSAVYEALSEAQYIGHAHHPELWKWAMESLQYPITPRNAEYGTPAIALAVGNLCAKSSSPTGVIVMGGHEEGLLFYGASVEDVKELVRDIFEEFQGSRPF